MPLDDFPAQGQPEASAFKAVFRIEPGEGLEDRFCVLLAKPDAIVPEGEADI